MTYDELIAFRLPADLLNRIDEECQKNKVNRSKLFREALEKYLANKTGDKGNETFYLGNQGIARLMLDDLRRAISCLQRALVITRQKGDSDFEEFLIDKLAIAFHLAGLHSKAVHCLIDGNFIPEMSFWVIRTIIMIFYCYSS